MSNETFQASEKMKKFFEQLLILKEFIKSKENESPLIKEIYDRFDKIIKEKK